MKVMKINKNQVPKDKDRKTDGKLYIFCLI